VLVGASEQQTNPKSEIRNPKENRNPKLEVRSSFCVLFVLCGSNPDPPESSAGKCRICASCTSVLRSRPRSRKLSEFIGVLWPFPSFSAALSFLRILRILRSFARFADFATLRLCVKRSMMFAGDSKLVQVQKTVHSHGIVTGGTGRARVGTGRVTGRA
jgi:hypothetical protein